MVDQVPVIDIGSVASKRRSPEAQAAVRAIADACREWGFFQVVNHHASADLLERTWAATRAFFALPRAEKLAIARTRENPRGYYDRELTKNRRDLKEVFDFHGVPLPELPDDHPTNRQAVDGANQWPASLPEFRAIMLEYFRACERLGFLLLGAMCEGLGLPADSLHPSFTNHTSFVRLNYYPLEDPLEAEAAAEVTALGDMALHHHTDAGALTILLQDDVGGLQVQAGDQWRDVAPVAGALVINVADMMQVWSNDRYKAALHRVRPVRGRERYSIPFFFNPSYDADCDPLPTPGGEAARYRTINWGRFRQARTDGDYADFGKEIQIADFRAQ